MALPTSPTTSAGGGVVAAAAAFVAGGLSAYLFFKQWPTRGAAAEARAHRPSPTPTFSGEPLLAGRVVVVTGGSSGIGREIALLCAAHGARVIVFDLTPDPLEGGLPTAVEAAKRRAGTVGGDKLNTGHGEVLFLQGDTAAEGGCARAVDEAVERWGRLDVWVNNAAIGQGGTLLETSAESWDKVLGVNARGYFLGCKAAVTQFLRQPITEASGLRGRLINISSQHGMVACPGDIAYGVGKAAAVYMTRQIAVDYASEGIACNAVAPGKVLTGVDSDVREYSLNRTPCPRLGRPSDVAQAVLFLASDMASCFITGTNLMVDGGWTAY
eukprot:m.103506 g.103506  ORF g.103506 m.103506 type:complete len:327 (+) comp20883_c0_seq1:187-1167(+)